jgi:NAD(P)-dependent dehydrogenase (short-subunit alcohol dehydrogenase family)
LGFVKTTCHDTYPAIDPKTQSDCTGKYVLITGASKGIGRVTAVSFAKAGASHIAISARSKLDDTVAAVLAAAKEAGHTKPTVLPLEFDVNNREGVSAAAKTTEAEFGKLDILVNNAGYLATFTPLLEGDEDEYWKTWEVNYRGIYWVTKAFLPLVLKSELKTVLNLSSIGALLLVPGASAYQVSKFAILKLTEFFNVDYANQVRLFLNFFFNLREFL